MLATRNMTPAVVSGSMTRLRRDELCRPLPPPAACRLERDLVAAFRAEHGCARGPALQSTEPTERRGVGISRLESPASEHFHPLGGRVATLARRADLVCFLGFEDGAFPVAHQAPAAGFQHLASHA